MVVSSDSNVGRQHGEPISGECLVSRCQRTTDAERARQFQREPLGIVQRVVQECFQWSKAAGRPPLRVAVLGAPGEPRADGKPLDGDAQQSAGGLIDEGEHLRELVVALEDVHFVDDDDDFLAPVANRLQERALAFRERPIRRGHEQNQIGARHELARQPLVLAIERIGPWGVDDLQVAQQLDRGGHHHGAAVVVVGCGSRTVANQLDARGGRCHPFLENALTEQRVHERALAGVELTDDDDHEELVQLPNRCAERREIRSGRGKRDQDVAKVGEQLADFDEPSLGGGAEQAG